MSVKAMPKKPVIAIAGSTGAVGQELLDLIEERNFPFADLKLLASARSAGKKQTFMGKEYTIEEMKIGDCFEGVDIAFFSAGGSQSTEFAPMAAKSGAIVIDNSSAYRMDPECPLVIPEVNPDAAFSAPKGIIANPNCSTIIMNMVVYPIYKAVGVSKVVVSTYQAASGAGAAAMRELEQQAVDWVNKQPITQDIFGRQYMFNLFSHNSPIDPESGNNEEEIKMIKETKKIFSDEDIKVSATCIRVPVLRAHCESINITLKNPLDENTARDILAKAPGVSVQDDRANNKHPEPIEASFKDDCIVGRIRQDPAEDKDMGLQMFVAGDQIRKGAALNAIQIAELLISRS